MGDNNPKPDSRDFLWRVIGRYDTYTVSTNVKVAAIITYNVLVVGSIILKFQDILQFYAESPVVQLIAAVLLVAAGVISLYSLWLSFRVLRPYLESHRDPNAYHSAIFFEHVAEHKEPQGYLTKVDHLTEQSVTRDLAFQAHAVARGAVDKFRALRWACNGILWFQWPALAALLLIKFGLALVALIRAALRP